MKIPPNNVMDQDPSRGGGIGFKALDSNAQPLKAVQCYGVQGLQCRVQALHCSMLCITIMGPIAGLHSPCTKKHTPIRVREKNFLTLVFDIKSQKIRRKGGGT